MTLKSQITAYGISLQLYKLLDREYPVLANTTLNEKFNIYPNYILKDKSIKPSIKYFAIGVGGSVVIDNGTTYTYSEHDPIDAALFQHIPFVMRTVDNDLSDTERALYRFRKIETHNGIDYVCYYLKYIDTIIDKDYFYKISTVNEDSVLGIYSTDTDKLLNPTPKTRTIDKVNIDSSEYIAKIAKLKFVLTEDNITDLQYVLSILNLEKDTITELGVCSGIDIDVDGYKEAIVTQICFHSSVNIQLSIELAKVLAASNTSQNEFIRAIEIGGMEPLIL